MFAVIAQGVGYTGSAFFTTRLEWEDIKMRLENEPLAKVLEKKKMIMLRFYPDTNVIIRTWHGNAQSLPVIVIDSGHAPFNLDALKKTQEMLLKPYVPESEKEETKIQSSLD